MKFKKSLQLPEQPGSPWPTEVSADDSYIDLESFVMALWARRWFIALVSIAMMLVALVVGLTTPVTYSASVKLLVLPPPFKAEIRTAPLTVETYREIADSAAVKARVIDRLEQEGLLRGASVSKMEATLTPSRIPNEPFSPLIELSVEASAAELAQKAANAWGEIFVRENATISSEGKAGAVDFIQSQYPIVTNTLRQIENQLKDLQDSFDLSAVDFNRAWDQRLATYTLETQRLLGDHKTETERRILEFSLGTNEQNLKHNQQTANLIKEYQLETQQLVATLSQELRIDALQKRLIGKQTRVSDHHEKLGGLRLELKTAEDRLTSLREQLQLQPQFVVVAKAITDDALFNRIGKNGELPKELARLKLESQQVNPVHQTLVNDLVTTKVAYDGLFPKRDYLLSEISVEEKEIETLTKDVDKRKLELATLERSREVGLKGLTSLREKEFETLRLNRSNELERLKISRGYDYGVLETQRKLEADDSARQRKSIADERGRTRDLTVAAQQRDLTNKESTYKLLAEKSESAQLAKADLSTDIKMVAPSTKPGTPNSQRPYVNAGIALMLGVILSSLLVLGRTYMSSTFSRSKAAQDHTGSPR